VLVAQRLALGEGVRVRGFLVHDLVLVLSRVLFRTRFIECPWLL
jgi:hypothetical protein